MMLLSKMPSLHKVSTVPLASTFQGSAEVKASVLISLTTSLGGRLVPHPPNQRSQCLVGVESPTTVAPSSHRVT